MPQCRHPAGGPAARVGCPHDPQNPPEVTRQNHGLVMGPAVELNVCGAYTTLWCGHRLPVSWPQRGGSEEIQSQSPQLPGPLKCTCSWYSL